MIMSNEYSHSLPLPTFDRDFNLRELLSGVDVQKLQRVVEELMLSTARLISIEGDVIFGGESESYSFKHPIRYDMEVIGQLETDVDSTSIKPVIELVGMLMESTARYLMTSDLHVNTVQSDYETLQKNHKALRESQEKYKSLSEQLEQRVVEQVKTIESAQQQLYQAEKMASVGQLAAGVAHEINNPIGFIASNLNTASNYVEKLKLIGREIQHDADSAHLKSIWETQDLDFVMDDFRSLLEESIDGAERVTVIVKDLKGFSNVDRDEELTIDINDCIKSVCNIAEREISKHAKLDIVLGELPMTRCHPAQLSQVFLNLLLNAGQAIKEDGFVRIETSRNNNCIVIKITDTGLGIAEEILPRIFDPFYTTRDVGQGTGLGLTVCRDIINAHGGELGLSSIVNKGTVATVSLPITE